MALPHRSVATIDNVEFVNLTSSDISPLMSKCEIKVFYVGANRNGSFINKQTATEMGKTLRGAPIVGYFKENKDDFADHGEKVTLDDEGIHFECMTKPYGFVPTDARVWFQKFNEQDDFGNSVERQYLMTEGYLWTSQYEEAQKVITESKPQSMELDNDSLEGHWTKNPNDGIEYFIINDAIISKLCILGDDVEPCFEGASVTAPETSKNFTLGNDFSKAWSDMIFTFKKSIGEKNMADIKENPVNPNDFSENPTQNQTSEQPENNDPTFESKKDQNNQTADDGETEKKSNDPSDSKEKTTDSSDDGDTKEKDGEKTKHSLHSDEEYTELEGKFNDLQSNFNNLKDEYDKLVEFKNNIEDKQKDELIAKFYMLSDEDKKDVIDHKREYTIDQIQEKLAVIGYRKGVNFNSESSLENENTQTGKMTVDISDTNDALPEWIKFAKEEEKTL